MYRRIHHTVTASIALAALAAAAPASAQGTFINASLTADVVRMSHSDTSARDVSGSGETLGFDLRLGTSLGTAWGVEAGIARSGEIENEGQPPVRILTGADGPLVLPDGTVIAPRVDPLIFPPISYRLRTASRTTTFSAGIWARQDFTARVALVYTGGVGFHRTERDVEFEYSFLPGRPIPAVNGTTVILPPRSTTESVLYTVRPFVGIEARIGMGARAELVPGVRLHGLDGGLLLRPSVGIGWRF